MRDSTKFLLLKVSGMQRNLEEVHVWEDKIVVSRSRQEIELV